MVALTSAVEAARPGPSSAYLVAGTCCGRAWTMLCGRPETSSAAARAAGAGDATGAGRHRESERAGLRPLDRREGEPRWMHGGWLGLPWQSRCWHWQAMARCSRHPATAGHGAGPLALRRGGLAGRESLACGYAELVAQHAGARDHTGTGGGKAARFISWQQWLTVPSDTRYRQLQANTQHARTDHHCGR